MSTHLFRAEYEEPITPVPPLPEERKKMSNTTAPRERRPSTGAPIHDLQGPVGPGFSRPKHKRTFTGFGAGEIKSVEGEFVLFSLFLLSLIVYYI